jgi:putative ubiquitin-RnfH superfamily antitoxin RatB of RatAB toxin-antitoxin module
VESEMIVIKNPPQIIVEVAYALPDSQVIYTIEVDNTATVEDAILLSGIVKEYPDIDLKSNKIGIFSKLTKLNNPVQHKDRIEIYRKLIADPKAVRKQRAAEGKKMKKGK